MRHSPDQLMAQARGAFARNELAEAETTFRAAWQAGAEGFDLHDHLGHLARARGDLEAAAVHYAAALEHAPASPAAHANLAACRREQGHLGEAIALLRRATRLAPDVALLHASLGATLAAARVLEEAAAVLRHAVALDPALTTARSDLVQVLCALNRHQEAIAHYRAAYRREPDNNNARYLEALALLALGDFENGWRKHEVRWYASLGAASRWSFPGPSWLGEPDIAGRSILLHAEQGFGDTIQFLRYAPMVAARGARVRLLVPAPLAPLCTTLAGPEQVFAHGDPLPNCDTHCSLMSLPRAFRTTLDTIPDAVPYLHAPACRQAAWDARVGPADGRRHVAIAWSGSASVWNRAVPLARLAPLLRRDDCVFHAAQTEIAAHDRATMASLPGLRDHSAALRDFADTAALLARMDLVIGVDTALIHLAGAMARPVWTMLPFGADYRWMTDRSDSPWYPTMRLFRQPAPEDWASVTAAVAQALDGLAP